MTRQARVGVLMMVVGAAFLLTMLDYIPGSLFLPILGAGFLATYFFVGARESYGNVGFLIPGLVLTAIGAFALIGEAVTATPGLFFVFLAVAFLGVALLHTRSFREADHGERNWPLYPAGGLALFGILLSAGDYLELNLQLLGVLNYAWVAVLIGMGFWLVVRPGRGGV